jgi:hypothetical protein
MSGAHARHGSGSSAAMGFGPRLFSRAMSWACLGLSALMVVVAASTGLTTVVEASGGFALCEHPAGAVAAKPCPFGVTTTTTTFQVTYAADGHVIARKILATPPPNMMRWSPATVGSLAWVLTPLLLAGALWQGSRFFRDLALGRVFQASTVRRLRNFSMLGVAFLLSDALLQPAVNAVLRLFGRESVRFSWPFTVFDAPNGHNAWTLSGGLMMEIVFSAVLVAMVSVLARAAAIAEDHAQIV